ncbi:nitroreductase family deazaflavin-dependent oxidoreductase [Nocardia beijingensis]|nr:nitroreductase family deazaflavin-dependent oxidoreductase [Nocardia beijingensis]
MTEIDYDGLASDTAALDGLNRGMVAEFRANGGEVSGLPGGRLLLPHTTGAKSGEPRLTPSTSNL